MKMRDLITIAEGRIFEALESTAAYNQQILDFLNQEGIQAEELGSNTVVVYRTSMVQYYTSQFKGNFIEQDAYDWVMALIKEQLPDNLYIAWAGRNDDWMGVDVYERSFSR